MFFIVLLCIIAIITGVVFAFLRSGWVVIGGLVVMIGTFASQAYLVVDSGEVVVEKWFGRTIPGYYGPGLHVVNPLSSFQDYEALRREFVVDGVMLASDNNPLTVSVGLATKLNPTYAYVLQEKVGIDYFNALVVPAGQTAVREGVSAFPWDKASTSSRGEVSALIQEKFTAILKEQMKIAGLTDEQANASLDIFPAQLRVIQPDPKVLNSVSEKTASEQDLERQETLTAIADEEAKRREKEGLGVSNLFNQLPEGFTANEISQVLAALATKVRADAMLKAVETGQVGTMIMNGDSGTGQSAGVALSPGSSSPGNFMSTTEQRREALTLGE